VPVPTTVNRVQWVLNLVARATWLNPTQNTGKRDRKPKRLKTGGDLYIGWNAAKNEVAAEVAYRCIIQSNTGGIAEKGKLRHQAFADRDHLGVEEINQTTGQQGGGVHSRRSRLKGGGGSEKAME